MSKWSKEDRQSFENSIVMKELENLILTRAKQIEAIHEKIAQQRASQKMSDVQRSAEGAAAAVGTLKAELDTLADDGEVSSVDINVNEGYMDRTSDGVTTEEDEEASEEDVAVADDHDYKMAMHSLKLLAKQAFDKKDYKTLYEIERTMQALEDENG